MNPAAFWSERFRIHGHTGWADPITYAYDQAERLDRIRTAIPARRGRALDFGSGTGDFSRLLVELGYTVCGYDPFVEPVFEAREFSHTTSLSEIPFEQRSVDLVLSVTALDHITDDSELSTVLDFISSRLKNDGVFLLAEYALDPEHERFSNEYQALRAFDRWREILAQSSLAITQTTDLPHPIFSPSPGFLAYSRSLPVRLRRKLGACTDLLLKFYAARVVRKFHDAPADHRASPFKLLICKLS